MNMEHFAKEIYQQFTAIHSQSYLSINTKDPIVYPYLTYSFDAEALGEASEGFYLDVDVFDRNASYGRIFGIESALRNGLNKHRFITDEALFRFSYSGSTEVPTMDNGLKRRNVRFYVKIDWRK